jgi:molecular chaperone GrpE (heat shock protein)
MPEAERYAQLMVAPQLDAINRRLAELGAQRESALQHVQAAYAGYPERLQRAYEEARQKALESAIARGLGRSGVVDWQAQKLNERLSELIAENEAKKAAALAEVERNYQTELENLEAQRQTLAARRGEYARQFAEDLRRGYLDRVLQAVQAASALASAEAQTILSQLPYLVPTVAQEYERQRSLTEMFGYAPGATAAYAASPEAAFRAIEHVGRLGSPEAYLEAIRRKVYGEEPGGLPDREAAIAFLNQLLWMRPDIEAQVRALLSRIAS